MKPSGYRYVTHPLGYDPYNTISNSWLYDPKRVELRLLREHLSAPMTQVPFEMVASVAAPQQRSLADIVAWEYL